MTKKAAKSIMNNARDYGERERLIVSGEMGRTR
ncbi:hypothetical protein MES5069_350014 [Mesorhizobium escarrei]|uniref:Uncharacterized protein n=1 Tax=Mesorhizobium escarrei TaxID=666018 RepID=A0ABM9E0X4_9HYPH|nr:hypothetical protein MES5069_350014 [Mesorhizobium escarrei]